MRSYDVVVFGATGFTGKLVCEHLAKAYQGKGVRWAMAGRSQAKLQEVRKEVAAYNHDVENVELIVADLADQASVNSLAASSKVVITTVGPYARYGRPVVQACVESGTHYCDVTAEALFIQRMIEEFHEEARGKGVRIVNSCGFDSVPSDSLSLMVANHMKQQHNKKLAETTFFVDKIEGGLSGGTVESGVVMLQETGPMTKKMFHPYFLDPIRSQALVKELPDHGGSFAPSWSKALQDWTGPFFMDAHNSKIVRRSNALLGYQFGVHNFFYYLAFAMVSRENMVYAERWGKGLLPAIASSMITNAVVLLLVAAAKVSVIRKWFPKPGNGPAREDEHRDAGYLSTSRMLLECALCMALQEDDLRADPYASQNPGGILTPSAAFGLVLHERLKKAGYELEVCDAPLHNSEKKAA